MTPRSTKPIRLLIVDDHQVVRAGLRMMLGRAEGIEICGEADTAATAVAETTRLKPDVLLMDIRLPDGTGFDVCQQVKKLGLAVRVLVLTSFLDDETVSQAITSGADGYLLKEVDGDRLISSIRAVAAGQSILDPSVTKRVMERMRHPVEAAPKEQFDALSAQEKRVLALVSEGKTNKEIGVAMGLSDKTVKNYLSNAMDKLKFSRRSQAASFYVRHSFDKG
jgi:two-component system response regulator DevR